MPLPSSAAAKKLLRNSSVLVLIPRVPVYLHSINNVDLTIIQFLVYTLTSCIQDSLKDTWEKVGIPQRQSRGLLAPPSPFLSSAGSLR